MKKIIIAGNWKLHKNKDESLNYIFQVNDKVPNKNEVETIIFPQITLLDVLTQIEGKNLRIGAQNIFYQNEGAFTGEISPQNIKSLGVKYVLIGHSERRTLSQETDEIVNLKLLAVLEQQMRSVVCLGESLEVKEKNETQTYLNNQLETIFQNVASKSLKNITLAYEPIWAINTGKNATPEDANYNIGQIRKKITTMYDEEAAQKINIIYGGSVNVSNVESFLQQKEINGILAGNSSLKYENFLFFTEIAKKYTQE
ncbi:MAG: triosephosphate isomerase (TIM) [Candidatus Phytoplasma pruni]|uniref:triose-phosphate isomerase n=1 Tax=Poinsettia branch-inducing phytoplasma TaxID=138647 RepID=UPI00036BC070|nr:triose-phosphate isomerase [Poinsettia branch-inducing phytoplasma]WEK82770.1 MAG: triosephosphate isomerase (TIM) [Candidatus Phytoplasma pruni]